MKNPIVDGFEANDINKQIERLLRDLGYPEPPLRLEMVRDRLEIDLKYYSSEKTGAVQDFVHNVKVGGIQILKRPMLLWDAIRTANLRALFLPDRKRILIDESLPQLKHRWAESHEIGHSLIPWHKEFLQGDTENELSPTCLAQIEAEANYAAGQLLFLQGRFAEEVMSTDLDIRSVQSLKARFGNTLTSTLWRFVEEYRGNKPLVGIVSAHPKRLSDSFDSTNPCRYVIQSSLFRKAFAKVKETDLFTILQSYCGWQRGGPLGSDEVLLFDDNCGRHLFHFETFSNSHEALTLGVHVRKLPVAVPV